MSDETRAGSGAAHGEGEFRGLKGYRIYFQRWLPPQPARTVLLVVHGYAEHSGRYQNLVRYFLPRGYAVYALDHRGHGRSEGERVQIEAYDEYLTDLKTFFDLVRGEQPRAAIVLVGHSMGATISTAYAARHQAELSGLVLSGGGIDTEKAPPRPADLDLAATLSHDPAVVDAYRNDPLVFHGPAPELRAAATAAIRERLPALATQITLPVLIMAGAASPLGDGPRSEALYEAVSSSDRTLKLYDGLMHEIFNEPEHEQVFADLEAWLRGHRW